MRDPRVEAYIAWVDEQAKGAPDRGGKTCRRCRTEVAILHPDPSGDDVARAICAKCQGEVNRARMDRPFTSRKEADEWRGGR